MRKVFGILICAILILFGIMLRNHGRALNEIVLNLLSTRPTPTGMVPGSSDNEFFCLLFCGLMPLVSILCIVLAWLLAPHRLRGLWAVSAIIGIFGFAFSGLYMAAGIGDVTWDLSELSKAAVPDTTTTRTIAMASGNRTVFAATGLIAASIFILISFFGKLDRPHKSLSVVIGFCFLGFLTLFQIATFTLAYSAVHTVYVDVGGPMVDPAQLAANLFSMLYALILGFVLFVAFHLMLGIILILGRLLGPDDDTVEGELALSAEVVDGSA